MRSEENAGGNPASKRFLGLRPVSLVSWKDALLSVAPIVLLGALAIVAMLHFVRPAPPKHLVMAGGAEGSNFRSVAERYRKILARNGIELELLPSHGSADNLDLLAAGKADVALVQAGVTREDGTDELVSLGTVSRQPLMVFYRAEKDAVRLSGLQGLRIAIGSEGSGTRVLALALLAANGIEPGGKTVLLDMEGDAAVAALRGGEIDAVFLSGDNASLRAARELLHAPGLRLFDFGAQGEAYERRFRYLNRFELPAGAFDLGANLPQHPITMIAPTVELLAHEDLHPALSDLLVEAAQEVHSRGTLMQNPGEFPHPIEHDYPMGEDAARYYKSGKSLAYRYLPFWLASLVNRVLVVGLPVAVVLIPALRFAPYLYGWRTRRRIYRHYAELMALERLALEPGLSAERRSALLAQLDRIEQSVVELEVPGMFADQAYILRRHIRFVRDSLAGDEGRDADEEAVLHS